MRPYARPASRHATAGASAVDERPSRTQLKARMQSLQALGENLAALGPAQLAAIEMPDGLRDAIAEYHRVRGHEARRRQLQYIGRLMRSADEAPLREAVAALRLGSARATLALHEAERWRDEMIADDRAVARWLQEHPGTDGARLRRLIEAARADAAASPAARSGRGYRALFQFIKPQLDEAAHE